MELHISKTIRTTCKLNTSLFTESGKARLSNIKEIRLLAKTINDNIKRLSRSDLPVSSGQLNAAALINEMLHIVCRVFCKQKNPRVFIQALRHAEYSLGVQTVDELLAGFCSEFPPAETYRSGMSTDAYLAKTADGISNKVHILKETVLFHLAAENPAFSPVSFLFNSKKILQPRYAALWEDIQDFFKTQPPFGRKRTDLITVLREPAQASPNSLKGQLDYIALFWRDIIGEDALRLLSAIDIIAEEEKPVWIDAGTSGFFPPMQAYRYDSLIKEYERFSPDSEWMPRVVLMAKTVLVWLDQLSKKYGRTIQRLDEIPDEELNTLSERGFTGLWLIGVWKRSQASKRIKQINGNSDAAASAYSLYDYDIADELGGWQALNNLRARLWKRGIRLAADMVPNHTGMDSRWVIEKPDLFIQRRDSPFPSYDFNGENLSSDSRVDVFLENRYYSKTDCAVVFKRTDTQTGETRYIYHGNDGTGMPWNDTAQIDFLNPQAREEVIQKILHVARNFPIIRFDAAMVLAKKHIRRLWYPEPGHGGDIASRAEYAMSNSDFEKAIPNEFWREVVDRVAQEVPDTLLLAEAFWMMEGYFVRTLGMHRVYNSAFMNMLKNEENFKYRSTVKNTLEFDPQVLKRFVNFMNNPDEETAAVQFGTGDKYFGVCTLMVTMPGLPMFGHGQIEGFNEKYGMEFAHPQWSESENSGLIERHNREIFPLIKKRSLFAEVEHFRFYDVRNNGKVNENVFAYTNCLGTEKSAVFYNNVYECAAGWIKTSCRYAVKHSESVQKENISVTTQTQDVAAALGLTNDNNFYCIFQEQKSALWFIRPNVELFEKGMFIQLNGFECQVLLNIHEVCDTAASEQKGKGESGAYSLLCKRLGGKGCESMENELQDMLLKDLYDALSAFATKELFAGIASLCLPSLQPKNAPQSIQLQALFERHKKAALNYFDILQKSLTDKDTSFPAVDTQKNKTPKIERAWNAFAKRIEKLVSLCIRAQKGGGKNKTFIQSLYRNLAEQAFMPQTFAAYLILYSLQELIPEACAAEVNRLIASLHLERKMNGLLKSYGYNSPTVYEQLVRMRELNILCKKISAEKHAENFIGVFVSQLIQSQNAPLVLGANLFENTMWFNREKALTSVWTAALLYLLLYAKSSSFTQTEKLCLKVLEAVEQSAYKVDALTELLKPVM